MQKKYINAVDPMDTDNIDDLMGDSTDKEEDLIEEDGSIVTEVEKGRRSSSRSSGTSSSRSRRTSTSRSRRTSSSSSSSERGGEEGNKIKQEKVDAAEHKSRSMSRRQEGEIIFIDDSTSRSRSPLRQEKEDKMIDEQVLSPPSDMDLVIDEEVKEATAGEVAGDVNEATAGEVAGDVNEVTAGDAGDVNEVTGGEVIANIACLVGIK